MISFEIKFLIHIIAAKVLTIGTSKQLKIDISEDFLSRNFITFWWNISIFHQK